MNQKKNGLHLKKSQIRMVRDVLKRLPRRNFRAIFLPYDLEEVRDIYRLQKAEQIKKTFLGVTYNGKRWVNIGYMYGMCGVLLDNAVYLYDPACRNTFENILEKIGVNLLLELSPF